MPGRRDAKPIDPALCRRCQANEPTITIRTEPLCNDCFSKYVSTKVVKRMESFRVRHSEPGRERTLLLPLSFGAGSTVLLHLLSRHLQGQAEKTGRTGFKLHVLHVDDVSNSSAANGSDGRLERVKERFPGHAYSSVPLSDVSSVEDLSALLPSTRTNEPSDGKENLSVEDLLSSLDSPTSRTDTAQILRRKLILNFAKANSCQAILWGDSTTRLAERILADTAKGRGYSLPWTVADGESPHGVPFYFPMRDLLSKEIASFASAIDPPLDDLIGKDENKQTISMRDATIDGLMKQYFESVERDYPSIVANVVKTAGKLQQVSPSEVEMQCELCDLPLLDAAPEKSRLCYGCIRTLGKGAE